MATRCFSPPDRRAGLRSSRCPMPSVSTTGSNATVRAVFGPNQRPNREILPDGEMREELSILKHEPDPAPIGGNED